MFGDLKLPRLSLRKLSTLIITLILCSFLTPLSPSYAETTTWAKLSLTCSCQSIAASADGSKLVTADSAGATGGRIYTSTNYGATWTAHESNRNWVAVASSADGVKLAAAVQEGLIYTSTDSGSTWSPRDSLRRWSALASSLDGTKLVAAVEGGWIYTSTDSGLTWTARDSVRNWTSVASSGDGVRLVATARADQIFTSSDSGLTWTARDANRLWRQAASSTDGLKLAAVVYGNPGNIYTSSDAGSTWTARALDLNKYWQAISISNDATKLVATSYTGSVYTSTNSGATWTPVDSIQSGNAAALSADGTVLIVVAPSAIYIQGAPATVKPVPFVSPTPTPKPTPVTVKTILNGKCSKLGSTVKVNGVTLKCSKVGKKLLWQKLKTLPVKTTPAPKPVTPPVNNPCTTSGICPIGSTGPGGGIVFYDAGSQQSWGRYLEAAPNGWSGKPSDPNSLWCNVNTDVVPTITDPLLRAGLGRGNYNTNAMLAACASGAATLAHNYRGGGMQNWYLPSSLEAKAMYDVLWAANSASGGTNIGKFNPNAYWTSTQADWDYAGILMVDGTLSTSIKVYALSIRPVRAF